MPLLNSLFIHVKLAGKLFKFKFCSSLPYNWHLKYIFFAIKFCRGVKDVLKDC